jgi:hypothetical protein
MVAILLPATAGLQDGYGAVYEMKGFSPIAMCLGVAAGFAACCLLGRASTHKNIYNHFLRLHPFLEQETSYYPTASQLVAVARAQCPPAAGKTLVVLGGNSVFNGSGQKHDELWSRVLQDELGDHYSVVNFSAPGAGIVDNGGVIFECLAREYPQALFVTNTEPGYYPAANHSAYSYLFWDAYYKGLLWNDSPRATRLATEKETPNDRELKLGRRLNSALYYNDLWTYISYRYVSTVWTSWLKERSFRPRRRLPDWYDRRPPVMAEESEFDKMLPGHLDALRHRRGLAADRYQQAGDGSLVQTSQSLEQDEKQITALLPHPLERRSLVVLTPYNPWFLAHLTEEERERVALSYQNGAALLEKVGFHALPLLDRGFVPEDFGDTVHLSPAGGRRLAHLVAESFRTMNDQASVSAAR